MAVLSLLSFLLGNITTVIVSSFVALVTVVLVKYMCGPKAGKNPFSKDTTLTPKPLVTDQNVRDDVIKQGFAVKKVPDNLDAIVIGSGIGGLAAASLLARAGKKVLVLEQHDQAGGCCHTFIDKGYEFDVGIHYIGEMTYNSMLKVYVDHITDGQLQWATMADPFDTIVIGQGDEARHYPRFSGKEKFRQGLVDKFPDEIVAIDKWMKYIESSENTDLGQVMTKLLPMWLNKFLSSTGLFNLFTNYYKYSQRSVKEMAEELTTNKDLQAVMSYCHGDYGTLPGDASFALHCGLMFHFLKGASYPVGGASEIAFHIIPSIEKAGGKVLVRAPVSQVLLDGEGGAYGVRVHKSSGDVDIHAPIIISDAGFFNTFQSLLPPQIMDKSVYKPLVDKGNIKHGVSCMSLFVGLKGSKKELGIEGRNWWLFPDNDLDKQSRDFLSLSGDEIENQDIPLLFISFPSAKDPTWEERYPGKSTCAVITMANWEWFQEWEAERVMKRGEVYEKRKNALADALWKRTLKMFPNLEDKVEYFDIGSPVTNKYYIGSPKGEIYGLDHQLSRFDADTISALRSKTLVPNLYLTGQDVFCCGFAGALIGALLCAGTVLNRNLFIDVTMLQYKISRKKKGK